MKRSKKKATVGRKPKKPGESNRARASGAASPALAATQHISRLKRVHPQMRRMINKFLRSKKIPLKVHTLRFVEDVGDDYNCCVINGQIVCGPQCP
jgi:hypothetical protein